MKHKFMQKNLMIDYLEGRASGKDSYVNGFWDLYRRLVGCYPFVDYKNIFHAEKGDLLEWDKYEFEKRCPEFNLVLNNDPASVKLLRAYKNYTLGGGKNYVFSPYFSEILKNTGTDVHCDYLKRDISGTLHIDDLCDYDGEPVRGVLFSIYKVEGQWALVYVYITQRMALGYQHFWLDDCKVSECVAKLPFKREISVVVDRPSNHINFNNIIINCILCAIHKDEEAERYNEFATKKSKLEYEKGHFTSLPYIFFDQEKPVRNQFVTHTFVRGHGKWQAYGEKWSKLRFRYIDPGIRHFKKEDGDE
jgi:hypothetical protein